MSAVALLPTRKALDAAWERYAEIARAIADDPRLAADRAHCEAMVRTFKEFRDLYEAVEMKC